jgi:predicted transcriptional regulator
MKVAISLPDPVFQAAEQLARRLHKPRSRLYAEAIAQYVGVHDLSAITERLNEVYAKESSQLDEVLNRAQLESLPDEAW